MERIASLLSRAMPSQLSPSADRTLHEQLLELLRGGGSHLTFEQAVADLPARLRGSRPENLPHTPWRLIEHMRIAQRDIMEFSRRGDYQSPPWPTGYWPDDDSPADAKAWHQSLAGFREDALAMQALVADPATDLLTPLPWGTGQTVAREAMLLADHNSYHLGQLVTLRRLLGAWMD